MARGACKRWAPVSRAVCRPTSSLPACWVEGQCLPFSQDPAGGPWEHADPRVQQLLEEKEQALALLQESVKVGSGPLNAQTPLGSRGPGGKRSGEVLHLFWQLGPSLGMV